MFLYFLLPLPNHIRFHQHILSEKEVFKLSNSLCKLLEKTPSGTPVNQILMKGEDWTGMDKFIKYDKKTGLAYFINKSNHTFVAVAERIDMIEFTHE